MRDTDYTSLRREFLGVGLTGAMVGLAGCSDSVTIETGSDDEDDGSTETPDIDTAGFSFSYDETAKQAQIEFTGGAAIDAGNVQVQHDAGREVLWAELGSTAAGPQEDIEAGAVAVLGPEILNWDAPIEGGETIRLIYIGKETPATLERYTPPGETDTGTTVPASISEFSIDASSDQQLRVSFIADKQLETLRINISGAGSHSLTMADFTEQQTGSGSYQYETTVTIDTDGTYTANLDEATDIDGKDSTSGQEITDTTDLSTSTEDTTPPRIDAFSIANPSSQRLRVSFDSSEQLSAIQVNISGAESISLAKADFIKTETSSDRYTYEAATETDSTGKFTATLAQATDVNGNDGANNQSVSVAVEDSTNQENNTNSVSFEEASIGANKPADPWSVVNDPTSDDFNSVEISGDHATDGSQSLHMTGNGELDRVLVGVNADLTSVAAVQCDVYIEQANVSVGEIWFGRWLDGESDKRIGFLGQTGEGENRFNVTGEFTDLEGDMSDLSGEHDIVFNMRGSNEAYFDNLRFLDNDDSVIPPSEVLIDKKNQRPSESASIDGFEDDSLTEWGSIEAAETTTETAYKGERSVVVTDKHAGEKIGSEIMRSFDGISPSSLVGALRSDDGAYNTVIVTWRDNTDTAIHKIRIRNYHNQIEYNNSTTLASTAPNTWYSFELANIDWEDEIVGEVRVNGEIKETNVDFQNPAGEVTSVQLRVHDGGTGSVGYFDEITVGPMNSADDE